MVQTLFSNYSKIAGHKFKDEFELKLNDSNSLVIASGYFGASTLTEHEKCYC
ncbi:MAG: hypothetical protein Q9N32_03640 [Gammaproteobacteria bacterium]|nr:hypothetical protein [Gammaproteobacteria bacterium]